ncbi:unnamed protein product [Bursaphelenchus xylophilus]|uniref:(pine wood nematode) hypothetical protein n=1 Tax=Bursaphelenchus xylophilus TaxID=6326 RepID=A0A1I7S3I4_BURXY|nr:unnamed protein product [Bursaphelenchus xylophilus]CAG9116330.1 unnamed protein product [Bursaphelenchus xylophilus]
MASEKLMVDPVGDLPVIDNGENAVKFTKDGESIDLKPEQKLIGLTKEQLEKYRNDPFWKSARYVVFTLFWIIWLIMFVGAILIVVMSPKCAPKKEQAWFQNSVAYQLFTPTFKDSDNDGVGDFLGIKEKLNDLRRVGITALWPTPLLKTDKNEFDPAAIVDSNLVDSRFGSEEDLKNLIDETHSLGLKFIADLPLTESTVTNITKKENKLVDINSNDVLTKLRKTAVYLLNLGVDGIHLAQYGLAYKFDASEKLDSLAGLIRTEAKENFHDNNPENLLLFADVQIQREQRNLNLYTRPLYRYPNATAQICHSVNFIECLSESARDGAGQVVRNASTLPLWQLGDVSRPRPSIRTADNLLPQATAALAAIQLFLPGSAAIYYGEELGLPPVNDVKSQHGLMAWSNEKNGGFSDIEGKPFFQQLSSQQIEKLNFEAQYKETHSPLKGFKKLAETKARDEVFIEGQLAVSKKDGLAIFSRILEGNEKAYILVVNFPNTNDSSPKVFTLNKNIVQNHAASHVELVWNQPNNAKNPSHIQLNDKLTLNPFEYVLLRVTVV